MKNGAHLIYLKFTLDNMDCIKIIITKILYITYDYIITMVNLYRRGRIAERKVMNRLAELGWYNLVRSRRSRGPWDIRGRTPKGCKAYIQVKSYTAEASEEEIKRLRRYAKEHNGVAILAKYYGGGKIRFKFLGNWC